MGRAISGIKSCGGLVKVDILPTQQVKVEIYNQHYPTVNNATVTPKFLATDNIAPVVQPHNPVCFEICVYHCEQFETKKVFITVSVFRLRLSVFPFRALSIDIAYQD